MLNIIKAAALDSEPFLLQFNDDAVETNPDIPAESFPDDSSVFTDECAATCNEIPVIPDVLSEARQKADEIQDEAERCAAQIKQEAKAAAEHIKLQASQDGFQKGLEQGQQEGYEKGYAKGLEVGKQEALQSMKDKIEQSAQKAQKIIMLADNDVKEMMRQAEHEMVDIIMLAVNKILAAEVAKNPLIILPVVQHALEKVCNQDEIVIRVNPENYDIVLEAKVELQRLVMSSQQLQIRPDSALALGDCVIDTKNGSVDARIAPQVELLDKALRELLP